MALNSINTNISAMAAQANIGRASSMAGSSIARLSSGNRITKASDDVAAMSAGTSLRTNVTTLKIALINTSQGSSLLQVADGALTQITDILQRQKSIAVQAGSGSLTSQERTFLNQEFQNLTQEVDRLSKQTNFNGVQLLDGVLNKTVDAKATDTNATKATASVTFGLNATAANNLIVINGVTFTGVAGVPATATEFRIGATTSETVSNLTATLNASTNLNISSATYSASGSTLRIASKTGGAAGADFVVGSLNGVPAAQWSAIANNTTAVDAPDIGSYTNMFVPGVALGALNTTDSVVGTGLTGTAAAGFTTTGGGNITVAITGGAGAQAIYAVTAGDSLTAIVDKINNGDGVTVFGTAVHGIKAKIIGSAGNYNIMLQSTNVNNYTTPANADMTVAYTGTVANLRTSAGAAMAATSLPSSAALALANTFHNQISGLGKAGTTGVRAGDTVGIGVTGNNLVTDQNQTKSVSRIIFPPIASANLLTTLAPTLATSVTLQIGETATANERTDFVFSNTTLGNAGPNEIAIGSTLEETIDNAVTAINKYAGNGIENYNFRQIKAYRDGQSLVIESNDYGSTTRLDNAVPILPIQVGLSAFASGAAITSTTLNNGTTGGISASNVNNSAFIGKISGFKATHTGVNDRVNVELTVGGSTYNASNVDTTSTTNTTVRLSSSNGGGYLDIELRGGAGTFVTSQANADSFANRLDAAFSTLDFYQKRDISSYTGSDPIVSGGVVTGSLLGTTVRMSDNSFKEVKLENVSVLAPTGSAVNAKVSFTINGEEYTSELAVGNKLSANQTFKFLSSSDSNKFLEFTTGNTAIQLDTQAKADSFKSALEQAFGVGENNASLSFQVGIVSSDSLSIGLKGVTTKDIGIESLDVLTQASSALAADAIDTAIDKVTAVRAEVGALQSRFNFAASNVESSIANQDSARAVLLDTDIAAESTAFSTAQVQLQAGISVLAQANQLQQNLLKLIG